MGRLAVLLAAVAVLALAMAAFVRPVLAVGPYEVWLQESQQGTHSAEFGEDEDCGEFTTGVVWHFILNQYPHDGDPGHLVAWFDSAGQLETDAAKVLQSTQHFYLNTPGDDTLLDAVVYVNFDEADANLVLSHVCHTGNEETPTPTPSESATPTPSESATPTPEESVGGTPTPTPTPEETPTPTPEETPTPTPEESVEGGTPTPTPEQSVQGGTPTPAPSLPDGAMSSGSGPSPLPTVIFGLILLASLATLAWVNVQAVRSRA